MTLGWPFGHALESVFDETNRRGTSFVTGAAAAKGSYTEIVASTAIEAEGVMLSFVVDGATDYLIDIALGSAGNEFIIIPDVYIAARKLAGVGTRSIYFPVRIPAGARVSARGAAASATQTAYVSVVLVHGGPQFPRGASRVLAFGSNGFDRGTAVVPSATANTWGSWAEIAASSGANVYGLLMIQGTNGGTTKSGYNYSRTAIGIGASSAESTIATLWITISPDLDGPYDQILPRGGFFPCFIPAGTRIAARGMVNTNIATQGNRDWDIMIYGLVF